MIGLTPITLPTLPETLRWDRPDGGPLCGKAGASGLLRCNTLTNHPYLAPQRWMEDPFPHSWSRDLGFEDDIIVATPTVRTGPRDTTTGMHPVAAIFADKTTLWGWKDGDTYYWAPLLMLTVGSLDSNHLAGLLPQLTSFINTLPPLTFPQTILRPEYTYRPYLPLGGPLSVETTRQATPKLNALRTLLAMRHPTLNAPTLSLSLYGRVLNADQSYRDITLIVNGAGHVPPPAARDCTRLAAAISAHPDLLGLTQQSLFYSRVTLFVTSGEKLLTANNTHPTPSAHEHLTMHRLMEKILA